MNKKQPTSSNFIRVFRLLSHRRRRQLIVLVAMLFFVVLAEGATVAAVIPVITAMANPDQAMQTLKPFVTFFGISNGAELRLVLGLLFIGFVFLSAGFRLLYLWATIKIGYAIGSDFVERACRRNLNLPYIEQTQMNSSHFLTGLMVKVTAIVNGGLIPLLNALGGLVLAATIIAALLVLAPSITLALTFSIAVMVGVTAMILRAPLKRTGEQIARVQPEFTEKLQIIRGGIRDIILDDAQDAFSIDISRTNRKLRGLQAINGFLSSSPRYFMETAFILFLMGLAYWMFSASSDPITVLPTLSLIAVGAMKLLPATQLVIFNWATIKSNSPQISDALDLIEGEIPQKDLSSEAHDIEFKKEIELKDVWFRYGDGEPWILEGINLRIPRGTKLGVIGQTGAGKSTLIDLLLGLLQPTKGTVAIDGVELCKDQRKSWGRRVAHVPQSIYLIDTSVAENIAFGKPKDEIVSERVVAAAQKARIHDFVNDGASGFKTLVGERGVRISGGQRQRIGIARALYKKADVIVLDEATSSLDMKTEDVIIQTILDLGRDTTLIMIAHRLTTLEKCDRIVELESGRVARECHYDEL